MNHRFDHVMISVRDLNTTSRKRNLAQRGQSLLGETLASPKPNPNRN